MSSQDPVMQGTKTTSKPDTEPAMQDHASHADHTINHTDNADDAVATEIETTITTETTTTNPIGDPVDFTEEKSSITIEKTSSTSHLPQYEDVVAPTTPLATPKKKHPIARFLTFLFIIVLLGLGGLIAWYFLYYNTPDKVAYDAIDGFLHQQTVVTDGIITAKSKLYGNDVLVSIDIDNRADGFTADNTATLKLNFLDANGEILPDVAYEIELGGIITSDGTIYIRTSNLIDSIDDIFASASITPEELDFNSQLIYGLLADIDGEWWQISVPDLIDTVTDSPSEARPAKEFYTCMLNVAKEDTNSQIADLYSNHRFVNIAKNPNSSLVGNVTNYSVSFNYDELASFSNSILDISSAKNAENCLQKFIVDDLGGNFNVEKTTTTAEQLREQLESFDFQMTISDFTHELKAIDFSTTSEDLDLNAALNFSHPAVIIDAPDNYRPITELFEELFVVILNLWENSLTIDDYPDDLWDWDDYLEWNDTYGDWDFTTNPDDFDWSA